MAEPDEYTNAWYRKQFRGFAHMQNRAAADYADLTEIVMALGKRLDAIEAAREADKAKIGELEDTIEKAREAYQKLKNGKP